MFFEVFVIIRNIMWILKYGPVNDLMEYNNIIGI